MCREHARTTPISSPYLLIANMATTLPSPPATPPALPSTHSPSQQDLTDHLDALLESYLTLLDTYTTLRAQLSDGFASGFLSLAHANRNAASVLGAGRRFGQDGYDERMKAIRGVRIQRVTNDKTAKLEQTQREQRATEEKQTEKRPPLRELSSNREQLGLEPQTNISKENLQHARRGDNQEGDPIPQSSRSNNSTTTTSDDEPQVHPAPAPAPADTTISPDYLSFNIDDIPSPSTETKPRNPLLWFTALPPPALRQTQSHFTSTITSTIPQLLTTISKMEALEKRIWDVRLQMGILHEYPTADAAGEATDSGATQEVLKSSTAEDSQEVHQSDAESSAGVAVAKEKGSNLVPSLPSPSKKPGLVSRARPSEPRSRVLKMD